MDQTLERGSGLWTDVIVDHAVVDAEEAKMISAGKLTRNSWLFSRARGSAEGNYKLKAGMRVTIKMAGEAFSGEYIADSVNHVFDYRNGYRTEFSLKRNMSPCRFMMFWSSTANGPGDRFVVWVQDVPAGVRDVLIRWPALPGNWYDITIPQIMSGIPDAVEGITISGGEPFEQPEERTPGPGCQGSQTVCFDIYRLYLRGIDEQFLK